MSERPGAVQSSLVRNVSLLRGLTVLRAVAGSTTGCTAAEIARSVDIPTPTVARLLVTLADEGFVVRDDAARWWLGAEVDSIGGDSARSALLSRAPGVLERLAAECGESAFLTCVRLPHLVEVLVQRDADRLIGATPWAGRSFDACRSVAGWMAAAANEAPALQSIVGASRAETRAWNAGIASARENGYALDVDGLEVGLTSIAVLIPLRQRSSDQFVVGVAAPSSRIGDRRIKILVRSMRVAASALAGPGHSLTE